MCIPISWVNLSPFLKREGSEESEDREGREEEKRGEARPFSLRTHKPGKIIQVFFMLHDIH
jgi:hypothetical protein